MALNTEKNPLTADLTMINARVEFLDIFTTILRPTIATKANLPPDVCMVKTEQEPAGKLSVWEDTHSPEVAFVMPFIGRWFIKGNTAGLDLDPLMLPFDFHYRENLNNQSAISCSGSIKINKVKAGGEYNFVKETAKVEVGVSPKTDWLKDTPIKTGVQGSAFIEIGKDGISDFGVEGKLGVKPDQGKSTEVAGMTIEPRIGKIELSTKVSWNAGATGNLKGQLHQSFFNYGN
jgi:hypothetical protein